MADQIIICSGCDFGFDAMDERGSVDSENPDGFALCPYCLVELRSSEEWAIWNDCNGIFELRPTRAEARKIATEQYAGCDVSVVPARAFVEPKDDHWQRAFRENEREAAA